MSLQFPDIITKLPQANISIDGVVGYLSQADNHQIVFLSFEKDTIVPVHSHANQWELVLDGKVDVNIKNEKHTYEKGDHFFIEKDVPHSAFVHNGYRAIAFFDEKHRYKKK